MIITRLLIILLFASISINAMEEQLTEHYDIESQQLIRPNYSVTTRQWHDSWSGKIIKFFGDFDYPCSSCSNYPRDPDNQDCWGDSCKDCCKDPDADCCHKKCCVTAPWNAFVVVCAGFETIATTDCITGWLNGDACSIAEYSLIPCGIALTGSILWTAATIFTTYKDNVRYYPHASFSRIARQLPLTQEHGYLHQNKKTLQEIITYIGHRNAFPLANEQASYDYVEKLLQENYTTEDYVDAIEKSLAVQKYNKQSKNQISPEIAEHIGKFVEHNKNNIKLRQYIVANLVQYARYASHKELFRCGNDVYEGILRLERKKFSVLGNMGKWIEIQGPALQAWLDCYMKNRDGEIDIHVDRYIYTGKTYSDYRSDDKPDTAVFEEEEYDSDN